ncbi:MAG: hypothetical protein SFY68_14125 [Candidatus Sumerlaeia bacterium]|nr:hypothetical protein [Candidatus Sumerlaeia bacterium]
MNKLVLPLMLFGLGLLASTAEAFRLTPLSEESIVVELTTEAESRELALAKAKSEAILGSVGRIFLDQKLLMADQILGKYVGNYADQFIDGQEILSEEFLAGKNIVKSKVFVNFSRLEKDLAEKRFIYSPAYKPVFTGFMTETLEGKTNFDGVALKSLTESLRELGMKPFAAQLQTPPSTADVSTETFLLDSAIISSQRSGIEIIVTGEAEINLVEKKKLYFDEYWFYETSVTARLIRVDTREVLAEATAKGTSSEKEQSEAIGLSLDRANEVVAQQLFTKYSEFWPKVVQLQSDYELLFTGVTPELERIIIQNLERLGGNIKVNTRKSFDRSTVLSIDYDGPRELLIENLNSCPYPTLYILNPDSPTGLEIQVSI